MPTHRPTNRRTALKTAGTVLVSVSTFPTAARAEVVDLDVDVAAEEVSLESDDVVSATAAFPDRTPEELDPREIFFGHVDQFVAADGRLAVAEEYEEFGVAHPIETAVLEDGDDVLRAVFPLDRVDFSDAPIEDERLEVAVAIIDGIFAKGVDAVRVES